MTISNSVKLFTASIVAGTMFLGCGSDDNSTAAAPTVQTGSFVDAPVKGLKFRSATQEGYTNEKGEFTYLDGENVEFFLGTLSFGSVKGQALVTPYTMAGVGIGESDDKATNIALLLQNFDADLTDTILDVSLLQDYNLSGVTLNSTPATMETMIQSLFSAEGLSHFNGYTLKDAENAQEEMDYYMTLATKKYTEGYLKRTGTIYSVFKNDADWMIDSVRMSDGLVYSTEGITENPLRNGKTYTITEDGKIFTTSDSDGWYDMILNFTDDYVEACSLEVGQTVCTDEMKWYGYYDATKAQERVNALNNAQEEMISIESGYNEAWLNGRTLYLVITDTEDDDNDGSTTDKLIVAMKFENGNISYDFSADGTFEATEIVYEVENGVLIKREEGDTEYQTLTNIDNTKITSTFTASWTAEVETLFEFFTKEAAQNYIDSL
ncbi:MAG: hypothetical protein RBS24_06655 [Bacilli bacterium]|nr:hypothetical protein [Bacilli bacterium]